MMPLNGFDVQVSAWLAGSKRAIRQGGTLFVSPAMFDLMRNAEGDELRRLLGAIECVTVPELPSVFDPIPLTVPAPLIGEPSPANYAAAALRAARRDG